MKNSIENKIENVIVIGGGPAGLSASIYLARSGLSPLVVAGSPPGGQLMLTSEVENYPGIDSILGPDLIGKIRKHAEKFNVRIIDENILKVDFQTNPFILSTQSKTLKTKTVLIATGAKALWLGLDSEQKYKGKGVSACATCDGFFFRNKVVAVIGGGDTALEEALTLTKFATFVYIIHRRDSFRASRVMVDRVLKNPKIEILWNTVIEEIVGTNKVTGVKLKVQSSKFKTTTKTLNLDGVFVAIGHKPDTELFSNKIELDKKGYIITSERASLELAKLKIQSSKFKMTVENSKLEEKINKFNLNFNSATSVSGVYAAGDCVDSIYRQAITASGMGVAAALDVERFEKF